MAWRFRKRVKILPGVHLNFSKKGISTTVGVKGASVNFGKDGTYLNTSIPGTGLSDRQKISPQSNNNQPSLQNFGTNFVCPNCKGVQPRGLNACGWCGQLTALQNSTNSSRNLNIFLVAIIAPSLIIIFGMITIQMVFKRDAAAKITATQPITSEAVASKKSYYAGDFTKLNYKSTYFDVINEFGEPDKEVSAFPPDAEIANTMMYYGKQNQVVFVAYEYPKKGAGFDRTKTHYLGTKGFNPEKVLHVSQPKLRTLLNAYKFTK